MLTKIVVRGYKLLDIFKIKNINEKSLSVNFGYGTWYDIYKRNKKHCFVAMDNIKVVGYLLADNNHIMSIAIDEKYRNKGIGKYLLLHCLNSYVNTNSRIVSLNVRKGNNIAINLYKSIGFYENKVLSSHYSNPVEDAIVMHYKCASAHVIEPYIYI